MSTNQRIRYSKPTVEGIMQSRRVFTTGAGQQVTVELNAQNKTFKILDAASGSQVASGGDTVNLSVLKIQAKSALMSLGVTFTEENRTRLSVTETQHTTAG